MNKEQLEVYLLEIVRITRLFREAIRQITELKVEITALCEIIENNGVATSEQLYAARAEARARLQEVEAFTVIHGAMPALEAEGEWKM